MMMKRYITLLSVTLATIAGMAQTTNDTINRMVLVESTYNPIIAGAVKRSFIPEEVKPTMNKEEIVYADKNVDLTNFDRKAKPAKAVEVAPDKGTPGYAHVGYGNYNNFSTLAAYKLQFGKNGDLAINAHADGWNGNLKLDDNTKWRSHLYDMGLHADYSILLGKAAVNAGTHGAYYNYNYRNTAHEATQQASSLGAYADIKGAAYEHYYYHAAASYTRFGRTTYFGEDTPHSENHIHAEASLSRDLYDWGMASLLVRSDVLSYQGISDYHNYYSLEITPRWEYRWGDFLFASGLNMDFLGGKHTAHPMQLSPECSISYTPESRFSALLTLDGGRDIHTFGSLYERSPYWASVQQLNPTYTFLNAHLDAGVRIIDGLHLHMGGGYKIVSDALFETALDSVGTTYTGITGHNAQVATVDGAISYTYKDLVTLSAKGAYHHWMIQGEQALLARTPQCEADVDTRVRIIPNLYAYTNLKMVIFTDSEVMPRERAIIDWSLGANYTLNKRFTFFLDAHNLLNHRHQYYTGYPSQGFNVLAGAIIKF